MSQKTKAASVVDDDEHQHQHQHQQPVDNEDDEDAEDETTAIVGVMEESNLTEEERRHIRRQQRELYKDLEEQDQLEVDEARNRNNELYKNVRYTREAVLDGENLTLIAHKAASKVEKLVQVPRYDADRLVGKLMQKCRTDNTFDWAALGVEAGVCFNSIPSNVCFLNGPLTDGQPLHVRQRPQRRVLELEEEEAKEERPEDVEGHTARTEDAQMSSIEKNMRVLQDTLKNKVDNQYKVSKKHLLEVYGGEIPKPVVKKMKKHGVEVCGVQYLFNPDSFTQTVENIFHFSFLIKKGSASIAVREQGFYSQDGLVNMGGPRVKYTNEEKIDNASTQAIVTLTMKDWRNMCKAYEVEKGDLPHRTGSKHAKRATMSQRSSASQG